MPPPEKLPEPLITPMRLKLPVPVVAKEPFWVSAPATLMLPTLIRMSPLLVIVPLMLQPVMTFQSAPSRFCTSSSKKTFILALPPRLSPLRFAVPAFTISTLEVEVRPDTFIVPFCSLVMVMPETLVRVEKVKPTLAQSIVPKLFTLLSMLTAFTNSSVPSFVMPPVPASVLPFLASSDPVALMVNVLKLAKLKPLRIIAWLAAMITSSPAVGTVPESQVLAAFQSPEVTWLVMVAAPREAVHNQKSSKGRTRFFPARR